MLSGTFAMSSAPCAPDATSTPDHPVFIAASEVQRRVALSLSTIHRYVANGCFPAPLKLGPRRSAWLEGEVIAWQLDVIAGRPAAPGTYPKKPANDAGET